MKKKINKIIRKKRILNRIREIIEKLKKQRALNEYENILKKLKKNSEINNNLKAAKIKYTSLVYYQNGVDLYNSKLFNYLKENSDLDTRDIIFELEKKGWNQLIGQFNKADFRKHKKLLFEKDKSFYENNIKNLENSKDLYQIRNQLNNIIPEEETEYYKLSNRYKKNQHSSNLHYKYNFAYVLSLKNDIVNITHYQGNVIRYELSQQALDDLSFMSKIGDMILDDYPFYSKNEMVGISKYKLYQLTLRLDLSYNEKAENWIQLFLFSFLTNRLIIYNTGMEIKFYNKRKAVSLVNANQFFKLNQVEKKKYLKEIDKIIGFKIFKKSSNTNLIVHLNQEQQSIQLELDLKNSAARGVFNKLFESNFDQLSSFNLFFGQIRYLFTVSERRKIRSIFSLLYRNNHEIAKWYNSFWDQIKQSFFNSENEK